MKWGNHHLNKIVWRIDNIGELWNWHSRISIEVHSCFAKMDLDLVLIAQEGQLRFYNTSESNSRIAYEFWKCFDSWQNSHLQKIATTLSRSQATDNGKRDAWNLCSSTSKDVLMKNMMLPWNAGNANIGIPLQTNNTVSWKTNVKPSVIDHKHVPAPCLDIEILRSKYCLCNRNVTCNLTLLSQTSLDHRLRLRKTMVKLGYDINARLQVTLRLHTQHLLRSISMLKVQHWCYTLHNARAHPRMCTWIIWGSDKKKARLTMQIDCTLVCLSCMLWAHPKMCSRIIWWFLEMQARSALPIKVLEHACYICLSTSQDVLKNNTMISWNAVKASIANQGTWVCLLYMPEHIPRCAQE